MYADKYVSRVEDVPTVEHYALIKTNSVHIPGDERSRTHLGHGYPAETKYFVSYEAYFTEEKLLQAIRQIEESKFSSNEPFRAIKITPMKISKTLTISIDKG